MRLTKIDTAIPGEYDYVDELDNLDPIVNKLGKHEDIEDELGIELITLITAMKEGFWSNEEDGILYDNYHHPSNLYMDLDEIFDGYHKKTYSLSDYGKTWALTKRELEEKQ